MIIFLLPFTHILPKLNRNDILVGVDRGSLNAIKNGLSLDYAIGDFDSVLPSELEIIKNNTKCFIKLNPEKDLTDTEYAINYFKNEPILIYGGIQGKRPEHLYANINLCLKYKNISFIDETSKIMALKAELDLDDTYYYYSFFAKEGSVITLQGFKYPLDNYCFKACDNLCISNEAADSRLKVRFKGEGIIIMTKYDEEKE